MNDLATLFRNLTLPDSNCDEAIGFRGIPVPGVGSHHLGKDEQGRPALLLRVDGSSNRPPAIALQNLRVDHNVRCRISELSGAISEDRFSLIHCQSTDEVLHQYFLDTLEVIIRCLPVTPTTASISQIVDRLASLFLAMQRPSSRSIHGLWGELFVIISAAVPRLMIEAWRNEMTERFDFGLGDQRLEVKSASDRRRVHHFSFAQAYPPDGITVSVASVFVERATSGQTLGYLWDTTRDAVGNDAELRLKVDQICVDALGSAWKEAREAAFDEKIAIESLAFYDVRDIPRIQSDLPLGVSNVHFQSDLSNVPPLDTTSQQGHLCEALFGSHV